MDDCGLVENTVREILVRALNLPVHPDEIGLDDLLFYADCPVDSVAALEIVAGIEHAFGITLTDDDVTTGIFESVRSLSRLVHTKLGEPDGTTHALES